MTNKINTYENKIKEKYIMTYEEAKEIVMSMPEVVAQGSQYVEEFIQGFMEAMNSDN